MIPSRHSNPFATCWTRPGAIPYCFPPGQSAACLVKRLSEHNWWGEIVGPHGSGKSTLLATLLPLLRAAGRDVHSIALHDGQRSLPRGWISRALMEGGSEAAHRVLVVDGYEQLAPWWRWWLRLICRRAGAGLLVTSHAPAGLPPLVCTSPDWRLVERLVDMLLQRVPSPITGRDIVASHACHGSNVRETLFDLYDRHEQRMRAKRTSAGCGT
jgi:energy-coupling factor transporter ATP-binding protein EcfA2